VDLDGILEYDGIRCGFFCVVGSDMLFKGVHFGV